MCLCLIITKLGGQDSRWKIESNYNTKEMDQNCDTQLQLPPGLSGAHVESVSHPVALADIRQDELQMNKSKMRLSVSTGRRLWRVSKVHRCQILDNVFQFLLSRRLKLSLICPVILFCFLLFSYLTHTKTSGLAEFMLCENLVSSLPWRPERKIVPTLDSTLTQLTIVKRTFCWGLFWKRIVSSFGATTTVTIIQTDKCIGWWRAINHAWKIQRLFTLSVC